jgi:hypothetical protein
MDEITIYRGDTKTLQFNVTESGTGSPYTMTGHTGWLVVKSAFDTTGSPYLIEVSGTVASAGSVMTFNVGSAQTSGCIGQKAAEFSLISGTDITTAKQFWIDFRQDVYVEAQP